MVHIPYLKPFEDVNKRVSRLSANLPLMRDNYCPLSLVDVHEHLYINGLLGVYELNQVELLAEIFVWAYERSCLRYLLSEKLSVSLIHSVSSIEPYERKRLKLLFVVIWTKNQLPLLSIKEQKK